MTQAIVTGVGLEISVKVDLDISDYTSLELRYTKPDDSTGKWTNVQGVTYVLENDMHYVRYTTTDAADIDQSGKWYFQVRAIGPGYDLYGEQAMYKFFVKMAGTFS